MATPTLDALVIKLLEMSHKEDFQAQQIARLVAQLPTAAAEVREHEAGKARHGPCSCGLYEEVDRLQKQLLVYIEEQPNSYEKKGRKKGTCKTRANLKKVQAMENARLTKAVIDQTKVVNDQMLLIERQQAEIEALRRELTAKHRGGYEHSAYATLQQSQILSISAMLMAQSKEPSKLRSDIHD